MPNTGIGETYMLAIFLQSLIIGYSGAMMPGPMFTYTVDKSINHGVKTGLLVSLGHAFLELILVVLIFAGVGKYLGSDLASTIIGIIGGIILAYLGFNMLRDVYENRISLETKVEKSSKQNNMLLAGVVLSATNPYFIIWWSAVGLALIMSAYSAFGIMGIALFYIGHILSDISWFTFVSALVSKTRHLINIKIYKTIIVVLAMCLIGFAIRFFSGSIIHIIGS